MCFVRGPENLPFFTPAFPTNLPFSTLGADDTVLSLKAETHNFPTTVEPFNGAATGGGGEIRDRMAGGKGSFPIAGTAVYMTSYPRLQDREGLPEPRPWLYHTPEDILTRASDGAAQYGNKFGHPLICGSLLCFEHVEGEHCFGYDKVIMQAGGVGFARREYAQKGMPQKDDRVVLLGGDNYRIGMGGGAGSSVATGEMDHSMELNAVQRSTRDAETGVQYHPRPGRKCRQSHCFIRPRGGGHLNSCRT